MEVLIDLFKNFEIKFKLFQRAVYEKTSPPSQIPRTKTIQESS